MSRLSRVALGVPADALQVGEVDGDFGPGGLQGGGALRLQHGLHIGHGPGFLRLFPEVVACFQVFAQQAVRLVEQARQLVLAKVEVLIALLLPVAAPAAVDAAGVQRIVGVGWGRSSQ